MVQRPLPAWFLAFAANAVCVTGAGATGLPQSLPEQLRIGVAYVTPALKSTEFRVFTEDGFEQDIGREIARSLGMKPTFVRIAPGDGPDLLATGAIDIAVERARVEALEAGRRNAIETGYRSAKSVAMRTDTDIVEWSNLAGRIVCVAEAGVDEQRIAASHGATLRIERAPALSLMLVRTGECDAALHDEALLAALFEEEGWQKFSATLPPVEPSALVVETVDSNPALRREVEEAVRALAADSEWGTRRARWARNVSFEVYLEQDAPDCH